MGIFNNWGFKLNAIVSSIACGITVSVLPNITKDIISENIQAARKKINKTLQILIYATIPMATGLCLLAKPVWTVFYGQDALGPKVFAFSIFTAVFSSLETNIIVIMQSLNKFKTVYISVASGLAINAILNIPMIILFDKFNLGAYNGPILATILGLSASMIISLLNLKKTHKINYSRTLRELIICLIANAAMVGAILLFKIFLPVNTSNRFLAILLVIFHTLIGSSVYIFITYKSKTIEYIFGKNIINRIKYFKK
jgi:O-antigen/teichoic acid export membrane protein